MMWGPGGQPDHLAFAGLRGGGKGGSQQTTQNTSSNTNTSGTSQTNLPPWLDAAAQQAVGTAQSIAANPSSFTPFTGQQVAGVSPATQQSWNYATATDPTQMAGQIGGAASGIYGAISGAAMPQQQGYIQSGLQQAGGLLSPWSDIGPISGQQVAQTAQGMMSPYAASVIAPTMQLGQQALAQNLQQIGAGANQAGAFGGSRQGVQEGVAQAQTALGESNLLGNLLNTGYNTALGTAGQLANTQQQLGAGAAGQLATMYGNAGSTMAGYGQQDITNALAAGQGLPQQYLGNLSAVGAQQQAQQQAELNAQMATYYGQQQAPIQGLDTLLSAVSGVPYGTSSSTTGTGQTTGTGTTKATTTPSLVDQIGSYVGLLGKAAGAVAAF